MEHNNYISTQEYEEQSKTYRYKIYARKSSEEGGRQIRSIDDQIKDCVALANRLGLQVIGEPIRESKSAKIAGRRPLFKALLREVNEGKIDGIIAWHPDRLARNMVEGGKIIDMLDRGKLLDLRFHSHQFDNSANGKMMLGMLFVFAKHYSDDLSDKVKRGVTNKANEGMSGGVPKHGYIQDKGLYRIDDYNGNHDLIKATWEMRKNNTPLPKIADYLNSNNYCKYYTIDDGYRKINVTPSVLSKMFADPFYYGKLVQGEQVVDMRTLPVGFVPMIDEDTYAAVQMVNRSPRKGKSGEGKERLPFRNIIYCGVCGSETAMLPNTPGKSSPKTYLYISCKNKECQRANPKNIRASKIIEAIEPVLAELLTKLSEAAYEAYLTEMSELSTSEKKRLRGDVVRLQAMIRQFESQNTALSLSLSKLSDERAIKKANEDISDNLDEITKLTTKVNEANLKLQRQKQIHKKLTPAEFREIIQKTLPAFQKGQVFQKERIIREIFSKLYYGKEKVESYTLQEPFSSLVLASNDSTVSLGGGGEIRTPAPGLPRLTI